MSSALAVLILVASQGRDGASTPSLVKALEQSAQRSVAVTARDVDDLPKETETARVATTADADVLAEVDWRAGADRATVHLHGRDGRVLRASDLDFPSADRARPAERARAVGFAIAAMLSDEPVDTAIIEAKRAATLAAAVPVDASSSGDTLPAASDPSSSSSSPSPAPAPKEAPRAPAPAERARRFGVEAVGLASADTGTSTTGVGAAARLSWNISRAFAVRVGGGPRWLAAPAAPALELAGSAGVTWTFFRTSRAALAAHADVLVVRDAWTEEIVEYNPRGRALPSRSEDRTSWGPGGAASVEAAWSPAGPGFALFAAPSVEVASRMVGAGARPSAVWVGVEGGARFSF